MDAGSPDTKEPTKTRILRRPVLKGLAAIGLATALSPLAPKARGVEHLGYKTQALSSEVQKKSSGENLSSFIEHHPLLINLSNDEKQIAYEWTREQINHYKRRSIILFRDVSERARNSGKWQALVNEKADNLGFEKDSYVRTILPALIFVESGGDEKAGENKLIGDLATDEDIALSLCQVKYSSVKPIAESLGIKLDNPKDLLNPDINVTLALEYIHRLNTLFPEPSLALWAYHLGEKNMGTAIYSYTKEALGKTPEDINTIDAKFRDPNVIATHYYTQLLNLNIVNMLNSKTAVDQLKKDKAFGDDTQYYVARALAGDYLIQTTLPS